MDDMEVTAQLLTYLNLLAPEYDLVIDWETSNINKKQLNFIGEATDDQISRFCLKLDDYCDKILE